MIAEGWKDYEVIATSEGNKLERWKNFYLMRPDPQVIWKGNKLDNFKQLDARYIRESSGGGKWEFYKRLPEEWTVSWRDLTFMVKPMGFKHLGLFPEQAVNWNIIMSLICKAKEKKHIEVLNLFAYTGGATVACAKAGARVTHIDAAKGMVERAKQNADLSDIGKDMIRYIVDDCKKFVLREIKRGKRYDGIIMDPPSYGRGPDGELWKLEDNLYDLVCLTKQVLSDDPLFFLINSYTTGLQPSVIDNILSLVLLDYKGKHYAYEVCLPTKEKIVLPCGCSGLWQGV